MALARRVSRLQPKASAGAARLGMPRVLGKRAAPYGRPQHPAHAACTSCARLRHLKATFTLSALLALGGGVSRLQAKASAGAARRGMSRVPRDPGSTLGTPLHPAHAACTSGARLSHLKATFTLSALLALAGRVSRLQPKASAGAARRRMPRVPRDARSTLGTSAASSTLRLHVWRLL